MKRDLDLIRKILLRIEAYDPESPEIWEWSIDGYSEKVIYEHLKLLIDAGYAEGAVNFSVNNSISHAVAFRLTMAGYDFLDNMRNDTVWARTKDRIQKTTGSASIEIVKELAGQLVRSALFSA